MNKYSTYCVVTTINQPTKCMKILSRKLSEHDVSLIVIGDTKGPHVYDLEIAELFTYDSQLRLPYAMASMLPTKHYSRKNIGYIEAISRGAECIYETDDDNAPLASWDIRREKMSCRSALGSGWFNVYRAFSSELIWPRGFPLEKILDKNTERILEKVFTAEYDSPIQQGLANLSPDVDAVWRLTQDREITFDNNSSFYLQPGTWCPFNSQTTWWWKEAFHLMYLPSYCSFRMTDIWRSFIAQRCLWDLGKGVIYHAPEVEQDRNYHNIIHDFNDEISGYQNNIKIADLLSGIQLASGFNSRFSAFRECYVELIKNGIFPEDELRLVDAWLSAITPIEKY